MIGKPQVRQPRLFYGFDLDARVPANHPLRQIDRLIDFSFVRRAVAHCYGDRGNESIDPAVTLKLLFLLYYQNVSSQRELLRQLPMRLDWLWFCGFDIDDPVPDHSVLTKARKRWGRTLFVQLFETVVGSCVEAGLVDGAAVHVDSSTNAADAALDSLKLNLRSSGEKLFDALDEEEAANPDADADATTSDQTMRDDAPRESPRGHDEVNKVDDAAHDIGDDIEPDALRIEASSAAQTLSPPPRPGEKISSTDPEARLCGKNGRTMLGYKDHRVIDDKCGIITATLTTHGGVDDAALLLPALITHETTTTCRVKVAVADKGYGQAQVYEQLHQRGIKPCIPHKRVREDPTKLKRSLFVFDDASDSYLCPGGQRLTQRGGNRYRAGPGVCRNCSLVESCTKDQIHGRQLRRHRLQDQIDRADATFSREHRRRLLGRRKTLAEGSFADAANQHGYKRHRWRGLEGAAVQNLLIATIQNIRKLRRRAPRRPTADSRGLRRKPNHRE